MVYVSSGNLETFPITVLLQYLGLSNMKLGVIAAEGI
jgi:hypothetical protein